METPLGQGIISKRCSPTFDAKKTSAAARFNGAQADSSGYFDEETEEDVDNEIGW